MPTTTCACCTGNGSTLGLLGKCWRVRVDPTPGRDNTELPDLPKSETSVVSKSVSLLWLESTINKKMSESQKAGCWKVGKSEMEWKCWLWRGKLIGILFCWTSYTNTHFLYTKRVVCVLKTSRTSHNYISFCCALTPSPTGPTPMCVAYVRFLGVFPMLLASETWSEHNITCWGCFWVSWEGNGTMLSQSGRYC